MANKRDLGIVPDAQLELAPVKGALLTRADFQGLAELPAEAEWLANKRNPNTRKAYQSDVADFARFVGVTRFEDFRIVARAHVIAWRDSLEEQDLSAATIRRKLAALSSLFNYLCENNAVMSNPVLGVERPGEGSNEGKTPSLGDSQVRNLLEVPPEGSLKGKRDRAILATLFFHGIRCEELGRLKVKDITQRRGNTYLRIHGKGSKIRFVIAHAGALEKIHTYLTAAGHGADPNAFLFQPVKNNRRGKGRPKTGISSVGLWSVIRKWADAIGVEAYPHVARATAATNALENGSDLAEVQKWLGHANIATTRGYDMRKSKPENSPTTRISY